MKMSRLNKVAIALVLIVGGLIAARMIQMKMDSEGAASKLSSTHQADSELLLGRIALGKILYQQNCAVCHGVKLEGQANWRKPNANGSFPAPPHDKTGHTWHHDLETLFDYIKLGGKGIAKKWGSENPNSGMPAYQDKLNADEIRAILDFIQSTWPQEIRDMRAEKMGQ